MAKTITNVGNPLTKRYPANNRYINGAFKDQVEILIRKDEFGESVVDKESYRLSLTTRRGAIGNGSSYVGKYMFEDGKYDSQKDFSYAMRKDLSIVELDRYIEQLTDQQENADDALRADIEKQINEALELKAKKINEKSTPEGEE